MAKLFFRYGAMNSGKSTGLLQVAHNYEERGMNVLLLKPGVDTKGNDQIISRLGVSRTADVLVAPGDNLQTLIHRETAKRPLSCILVDEAQFLKPRQVDQLFNLVVEDNLPVICYGLRTDFRTEGFPGSSRLLELAHSIEEMRTICRCGRKAVFNARKVNGAFTFSGDQVAIEGDEVVYESLCGECYQWERRLTEA